MIIFGTSSRIQFFYTAQLTDCTAPGVNLSCRKKILQLWKITFSSSRGKSGTPATEMTLYFKVNISIYFVLLLRLKFRLIIIDIFHSIIIASYKVFKDL